MFDNKEKTAIIGFTVTIMCEKCESDKCVFCVNKKNESDSYCFSIICNSCGYIKDYYRKEFKHIF